MNRQQQLKDIGVVMAEKRQWQYIASGLLLALLPVSYTHLDVYKRQP